MGDLVNGSDLVDLTAPALFGYIRIATNGRVLEAAMAVSDAVGRVRQWLTQPNTRFLIADVQAKLVGAIGVGFGAPGGTRTHDL